MKKYIISIIIILVIILSIFIYSRNNKSQDNRFIGTWISYGGTIYEFNKDNTGIMKLPLSEYKFKYKIDDNILIIDFENENAIDTEYKFSFDNNKLILENENVIFNLSKKN